jgi:hypothetical protein
MSTNGGPNIVRDSSLVLWLDAADKRSYSGSGSTWTDLTTNGNNGTLVNSPTFSKTYNGGLNFDGSSQYVSTNTYAANIGIYDASYTAEAWFMVTSDIGAGDNMVFGTNTVGVDTGWHLGTRDGFCYMGQYGDDVGGNISLASSTIYHGCWVNDRNAGTGTIYINGVYDNSGVINGFIPVNPIWVARGYAAGNSFTGNIYVAKIYNRALSPTEILQNYNALKGRFLL